MGVVTGAMISRSLWEQGSLVDGEVSADAVGVLLDDGSFSFKW